MSLADEELHDGEMEVEVDNIVEPNAFIPRGTDQQMRMGQNLVKLCPRYDRKVPWRQFVFEFSSWIETFDITACGDNFIKNTLVWAMKGQAQDMVHPHRQGSPTFIQNVTWREYAVAIERIFAPPAESQLAKSEFKAYKQRQTEDVSSYLSTKRALHEVAYPRNSGCFDNLLDEVINGLYNREVKLELRRTNPKNAEEMEMQLVQIVANERAAYENGYSRSETKDGLYHTTMMNKREPQEEAEGMAALKNEIKSLKETIEAVQDKSKISCYKCGKKGHMQSECRSGGARGGFRPRGRGNFNQRGGLSGGRFPYDCHHCGKNGHKKADCFTWKKEQANKGQQGGQAGSRVRDMEDTGETTETASYSRFLGPVGETEEN